MKSYIAITIILSVLQFCINAGVPTFLDWRKSGKVTPIKKQNKNCENSYLYSAVAQYQSLLAIQSNGATLYDLSEQYAMECRNSNNNCSSQGSPVQILNFLNFSGIPSQNIYQTQNSQNKCSAFNSSNSYNIKSQNIITNINSYQNLSIDQIQKYLFTYGPLTVSVFSQNNAFLNVNKSGVIQKCSAGVSDHYVLLYGYNSTHWFIKNSWGTSWGDNGFGYVLKTNSCNIGQQVIVANITFSYTRALPLPMPTESLTTLIVYLSDSAANGWNNNIIGFRQNNQLIFQFGEQFVQSDFYGPIYIKVLSQIMLQIVVVQLGDNTDQIGFVVQRMDGIILYQKVGGKQYPPNKLFTTVCPTSNCPIPSTIDYYIKLTDSYGDGWQQTILSLRQNNNIIYVGNNFTNGSILQTFAINFAVGSRVDIYVQNGGIWNDECGFVIATYQGYQVYRRNSGTRMYGGNLIASFIPQLYNYNSYVRDASTNQSRTNTNTQYIYQLKLQNTNTNVQLSQTLYSVQTKLSSTQTNTSSATSQDSTMAIIIIIILSISIILLIIILIFVSTKLYKQIQLSKYSQQQLLTLQLQSQLQSPSPLQSDVQPRTDSTVTLHLNVKENRKVSQFMPMNNNYNYHSNNNNNNNNSNNNYDYSDPHINYHNNNNNNNNNNFHHQSNNNNEHKHIQLNGFF